MFVLVGMYGYGGTSDTEVNPKSWTVDYDANLVNLY